MAELPGGRVGIGHVLEHDLEHGAGRQGERLAVVDGADEVRLGRKRGPTGGGRDERQHDPEIQRIRLVAPFTPQGTYLAGIRREAKYAFRRGHSFCATITCMCRRGAGRADLCVRAAP